LLGRANEVPVNADFRNDVFWPELPGCTYIRLAGMRSLSVIAAMRGETASTDSNWT
jgi:hypothetical protein